MFDFTGKKVFITGSSQGMGKAMAKAFVDYGATVIVHCSKDSAKLEKTIIDTGADKGVLADLSNLSETETLFDKTGPVDILIINASVQYRNSWLNITSEEFDNQVNVNFKSTLKLMQLYYPYMEQQKFGRIITIGSVQQYKPNSSMAVYAATKCAVMSLVENIAKQISCNGVTINNVSPGVFITPRNSDIISKKDDYVAKILQSIPCGRFAEADEIAAIILLLCSNEGSYITGADFKIDGGMSL